jgi:zinc-ribbon domain
MPEILTESFCERCGTRYTFESVAPRKTRRLGQFKTLSRGVKNWVMSDDSSLDEAMAAARSDQEREVTTQQLDAFHATFNFCMNCRQYTCSNCWNPAEGRCLTCSPNFAGDVLPAAFLDATQFEPVRIEAEAWPETDLPGVVGANGADLGVAAAPTNGAAHDHDHENGFAAADEIAPETTDAADEMPDFDAAARLAFLAGDDEPGAAAVADAEPVEAERVDVELAADEPAAVAGEAPSPVAAHVVPAETADDAAPAAATDGDDAVREVAPLPDDVDGRAAVGAARTADLLARFRPGQNIDAELAAYEAELESAAARAAEESKTVETPEGEIAAAVAAADVVPDPVEIAPEVIAAESELASEPEDAAVAAEAQPEEPVAAEPVAAEPSVEEAPASEPARRRDDRIEQPTWRIFAPEPAAAEPTVVPPAGAPATVPTRAAAEPQWPARPELTESPSMALLAKRTSSDELWAASAREVLAGPAGPAAAPAGIQPCSNCGLSLSATARFCRRCGTRQG